MAMRWLKQIWCPALLALLVLQVVQSWAQNTPNTPPHRDMLLLPEESRPPDANDQLLMKQQKQGATNFDTANALRRRQIGDDSLKLLILARDLKQQTDSVGDAPVPVRLLREAAVIELLDRDVQTRMSLMAKSG